MVPVARRIGPSLHRCGASGCDFGGDALWLAMHLGVPPEIQAWFDARDWRVRAHQHEMLAADDAGLHALLVADTGAGKTLAGFLPTLAAFTPSRLGGLPAPEGLHTLYVSPLKALAHDVQRNLLSPIEALGLPVRVETRSGDTPSDRKARQRARPPHVLLTTPESLSLLLSYPEAATLFAGLQRVVIDEVHAFATGKRGDLLALSMARHFRQRWPILKPFAAGSRLGARWTAWPWWRESAAPPRMSRSWSRRASAFHGAGTRQAGPCRNFTTQSAQIA